MVLEVGLAIMAIVAGAVGYFGRRYVERRGTSERLERATKLLDLHERMERNNLSPADLDEIEDRLLAKNVRLRTLENQALLERASDSEKTVTQAEMNEQAINAFVSSDVKLSEMLSAVHGDLPSDLAKNLERSQTAWKLYRDAQADLLARQFEGGSIQPLIRSSELERLTIARTAEIQDFYDEHKKLFGGC